MATKRHHYVDPEDETAGKIKNLLTQHTAPQRRRILSNVCARSPMLPYLGTEPEADERKVEMFDEVDPPRIEFPSRKHPDGEASPEAC